MSTATALSIDNLPYVNGGVLGMWLVQLRDALNSQHAGIAWENGRSMQPVTGNVLRRFVAASNNVIGALRVEGDPCELGDCSTLKPGPTAEEFAAEAEAKAEADEAERIAADEAAFQAEIVAEAEAATEALLTDTSDETPKAKGKGKQK